MLEAHSHHHLKNLLKGNSVWPHDLTLSRLVARSLRRAENSLIQLPSGSQNFWWPGLLIPLCLKNSNAVLILSETQRLWLLKYELPRLRNAGYEMPIADTIIPPSSQENKIWITSYKHFLYALKSHNISPRQLIIPEADLFSKRLRSALAIEIDYSEWESLRLQFPLFSASILETHSRITKRIFVQSTSKNSLVSLEDRDILGVHNILKLLKEYPQPWVDVAQALDRNWASWAHLHHEKLDWIWHLQPLEPLNHLGKTLKKFPFLMLSGSWENEMLCSEMREIDCSFNFKCKLGSIPNQNPIELFLPLRQPLPNTKYFQTYLVEQCLRLIFLQQGLTIVLLDDAQMRKKLTAQLASQFGNRVTQETPPIKENGVICCSCSWWLENYQKLPIPKQLILGVLPLASLESPLLAARVSQFKMHGRDWFRELILPDLLGFLPYLIEPIRCDQGRIAILDGRLRSRSWGAHVLRSLEPWIPLDRLLPI